MTNRNPTNRQGTATLRSRAAQRRRGPERVPFCRFGPALASIRLPPAASGGVSISRKLPLQLTLPMVSPPGGPPPRRGDRGGGGTGAAGS